MSEQALPTDIVVGLLDRSDRKPGSFRSTLNPVVFCVYFFGTLQGRMMNLGRE